MRETRSLAGARIGVLVESQFIPEEIATYQNRFGERGADVELISRLWNQPCKRFVSDVEVEGEIPKTIDVTVDLEARRPQDYDAVIMAANYTSVRLRYFEPPADGRVTRDDVAGAPAVRFFADAMRQRDLVKGVLCHGLWILTPVPELLQGRRVICHEVVLADVLNAGATYVPPDDTNRGVVVDDDLVTGRSGAEAALLVDAVCQEVLRRRTVGVR
jgi:protease I